MAENKKSFLAYVDWKDTFDALPDEIAGKLVKHLFAYVSDEQPESNDVVINAVFASIKNTLKRDLKKWEKQQEQRVEAGRKSAETRKAAMNEFKKPSTTVERPLNKKEQASTVSVSVSVTDSVSDKKKNDIEDRKLKFASTLEPFLEKCGREMLNDFYKYWTEPNKSNTKFRAELEKTWDVERRLETWARNDKNFKPPTKFGSSNQLPNAVI